MTQHYKDQLVDEILWRHGSCHPLSGLLTGGTTLTSLDKQVGSTLFICIGLEISVSDCQFHVQCRYLYCLPIWDVSED
ncbi:hypothetical protein BofuT4_uP122030.1 [Botrytis cinerea T4]|uniref:Uncharacterized protein n=1 Tax=Botryotinia fuckeliana (strain T4) TaxID=999810 RepID=G2YNI6_BOTF4|nr:hypothetical protein BofuT4_uP122030.1 [Botrytis cinerea T4]